MEMGETPENFTTMTHMSSIHDMSFKCIECGADNKDIEVESGFVSSGFMCQTCRSDPTKVKYKDLVVFSDRFHVSGMISMASIEDAGSVLDCLRQIHKEEDLHVACRLCKCFMPEGYDLSLIHI